MRPTNKIYPLRYLSSLVGGRLLGEDRQISGVCALEAPLPGHITFIRSQGLTAVQSAISSLGTSAAFIFEGCEPNESNLGGAAVVVVADPQTAFLDTIPLFFEERSTAPGIHATAQVDPLASIDPSASVGAFCVIGEGAHIAENVVLHAGVKVLEQSRVGRSTILHDGVVIRERCTIGANCIIHNNSIVGADGFGYIADTKLGLRKVPQLGTVEVSDDVEIGANSCIDRGAIGPTRIGRGTKIDNLVQVGHNVTIGSNCLICGQVGIAGSAIIGDGVVLGGQVGVANHISIANGSRFGGGTSITGTISEKGDYMGYPLMSAGDWRRFAARVRPGRGARSSTARERPNRKRSAPSDPVDG